MKTFAILLFFFILIVRPGKALATVYDYTYNNEISLIEDAKSSTEIKIEMVKKAKHHIHILYYCIDNSDFTIELIKELKNAHDRGVEVRVVSTLAATIAVDPFLKSTKTFKETKSGPIFSYVFLQPFYNDVNLSSNLHEKIFIVDGEEAIIGGRNLSKNSFAVKDMEARIRGDLVSQIQHHFEKIHNFVIDMNMDIYCLVHVSRATCSKAYDKLRLPEDKSKYYPAHFTNGHIKARLISHNAVLEQVEHNYNYVQRKEMNDDIINAITETEFSEMIGYNYFILPTDKYRNFLEKNIEAKKDIRIMTNSQDSSKAISDKGYILSLPEMGRLVDQGLNLYQWKGASSERFLHEKVIVFDRNHIFLGSHNFGLGSTMVSNEIAIEFFSDEIGDYFTSTFQKETSSPELTKIVTKEQIGNETRLNQNMLQMIKGTLLQSIIEQTF